MTDPHDNDSDEACGAEEANDDGLQARLDTLRGEHRDLDDAIARLGAVTQRDELLIRRMKKRKLQLKDRISTLERLLQPDEPA